jgi:hypothetical protein
MSHQLCRRRHGLAESPAQRDRPDGPGPQRRIAKDGDVVVIDALRERSRRSVLMPWWTSLQRFWPATASRGCSAAAAAIASSGAIGTAAGTGDANSIAGFLGLAPSTGDALGVGASVYGVACTEAAAAADAASAEVAAAKGALGGRYITLAQSRSGP